MGLLRECSSAKAQISGFLQKNRNPQLFAGRADKRLSVRIPGYDAVFSCPLIPTDSAQLLAAVATGSTVLGSSRSELTLQPVCRCLPDCAYPFETSLCFTLN